MPELPEVEGIRRRLGPLVLGERLSRLVALDSKLWHPAEGLAADSVAGCLVQALDRRAKLLIFALEALGADPSAEYCVRRGRRLALVLHLKVAGQVVYVSPSGERWVGGHPYPAPDAGLPGPATRFALSFAGGATLYVNDQRRFAWLRLLPAAAAAAFVAARRYGPDPLDPGFTPAVLAARLRARQGRPLKAALLDQTCIAGLGNIYADEALHRARLHPMTRTGDLGAAEVERLHRAIVEVLGVAVPVGGAVVKQGRAAAEAGTARDFLRAHGRAGHPCPQCGTQAAGGGRIVRAVLAGRGTYFCPACQPAPPGFVMPPDAGDQTTAAPDEPD